MRLHERAGETVSLKVRAGEILGIAGVDGNGQQELEEMIVGNRRVREGEIFYKWNSGPEHGCQGQEGHGPGIHPIGPP